MRVLVCDGQAKQALPVVRDLTAAGYEVWVASPMPWLAAACWSRGCHRLRIAESTRLEFISQVIAIIDTYDIDVVLPLKDVTTRTLARDSEFLGKVRTCLAPPDTVALASHKSRIGPVAAAVGLAVPRTVTCTPDAGPPAELQDLQFPAVVKAAHGSGVVRYVNTLTEANALVASWLPVHGEVVVQEYVPGEGVGFFGLYDRGTCVAWYTHRRRREYPATGGISVSAESTEDPALARLGRALLDRLEWHGPAMVECKRDPVSGDLTLLEVNTKFWGSLDLALACGLPFPRWAVAVALGAPVEAPEAYPAGVRVHWPAPAALAQACTSLTALRGLLADLRDSTVRSDWRWDDPVPHLVQLAQVPGLLWQTRGRWGAPHGRPHAAVA